MVKFAPDSETSRLDPIVLPALAVLTFILISLVWIAKVGASLEATHNYAPGTPNISLVVGWITKTGKPTVVRARVAEGLDLEDSDVPVTERGFRAEGEKLTHVCAVGAGSAFENMVFFSTVNETDGSATVWRTNRDGTLIATVVFDSGLVAKMPNSGFNTEFRSEVDYFLRKARSAKAEETEPVRSDALRTDSQYGLTREAPLGLETRVLASSPFILPAIVLILMAGASSHRRRH